MSLLIAQDLLRQYNKNNPYKRTEPIDSQADQHSKKFGTWSYANMYDALYDKYSQNKNFNVNMWHQAIKLGEQDQYLAFLEQSKDSTLSKEFYDPQYYNYESMMLELYKPFADATNKEERVHQVFDQATQSWVEESLGEMSDQEYIQYQLNQSYAIRSAEITRDLEQWRKDQLGWWGQFGNDIAATIGEFGEGLLSGLTGIVDFVAAVGTLGALPYAMEGFEGNYLDAFVDYFGENGLTAAEKRTVRAALDEYERTHTHFRDIDGNMTGVGKYMAGISNSIGMMAPAIVTTIVTGGLGAPTWIGTTTFYASIFSNNLHENATNREIANSPAYLKIGNAAVKAGVEAVVEWALGKILGGTVQNQLIGLGGRGAGQPLFRGLSKTSGLKYFFKSAAQEGLEEFLQDFSTNCVDQFTDLLYEGEGYGNNSVTIQTLIDSFCIGMLSSMFMSGAHIVGTEAVSGIRNAVKPGSGDLLIETKDGPQRVRGFNRLYYSHILSDFREAVDQLKNNKMSAQKNIELAQEVYSAVSAISQFYSSFDMQRIKNCEMLLDRVVKAEQSKETVRAEARTFAEVVDETFRSMVGGVALRHTSKIRAAAEKGKKILEEGKVTEVTGAIDTDGVRYNKDPDMEELEARLGKKAVNTIEELRKGYEWIITTDGQIAYESDGYLFVSEAWLQNYKVNDIYKYLEQTRVLEALTTDKTLAPMVKKLVAFDREFTGQTNVTPESAMMDLLFNKSVYQAFLLSNAGKNAHEYKQFIFQLHEIVKDLANRSKYHQQLFKGKQAQRRINMFNQIYEQIKETMREPTITAILVWHFDPQVIGADSVLTQRDREVINQMETRRKSINGETSRSAHRHTTEEIFVSAGYNDKQENVINKHLDGTATLEESLEAIALLDYADARVSRYDFETSPDYSYYVSKVDDFTARLKDAELFAEEYGPEMEMKELNDIIEDIEPRLNDIRAEDIPEQMRTQIDTWFTKSIYNDVREKATALDLRRMVTSGIYLVKEYSEYLHESAVEHRKEIGLGAFTIPYQAASLAIGDRDIAGAQFVTDKLNEFKEIYGISVRQMLMGDLNGMSLQQRDQLTQDMEILGIEDIPRFVITKVESMLGNKYVLIPTYKTDTTEENNADQIFDFFIAKSIPAEEFIHQDILELSDDERDEVFENMFKRSNVDNASRVKNLLRSMDLTIRIALLEYADKSAEFKAEFTENDLRVLTEEIKRFRARIDAGEDAYSVVGDFFDNISRGVNPLTGEVFAPWGEVENKVQADLFNYHNITSFVSSNNMNTSRPLSDFIDISRFTADLSSVRVYLMDEGLNGALGYAKPWNDEIVINSAYGYDYFYTLVHEVNHVLQYHYDMQDGFNGKTANNMPGFLVYVVNHYRNLIEYALTLGGYSDVAKTFPDKFTNGDLGRVNFAVRNCIAHCAYMLVQGEVWARRFMHNGKIVRGFDKRNDYLIAPDGKTKFKIEYSSDSMSASKIATFKGKQFWSGAVNLLDGVIEEVHSYEEAEKAGWHHSLYFSPAQVDKMDAGETAFFWVENGVVYGDWRDTVSPEILRKIEKQISFKSQTSASSVSPTIPEAVAESAFDVAIQKLFLSRDRAAKEGTGAARNTYHSRYTGTSSTEMTQKLMGPNVPFMMKYTMKLDELIKNPNYLSPQIKELLNGDFSEGNVYYRVREYVEKNFEGVSLDRTANTHRYVFVNDNAFDDLLLPSMRSRTKSNDTFIVEKYGGGNRIPLREFYSRAQLSLLGVSPDTTVIMLPFGPTETVFDENNEAGTVFINTTSYSTDKEILDVLNHEFRHVLQNYHGFEGGFTPDFKVTKEMIADVKKQVPGLFKNNYIVDMVKDRFGNKWEEALTQRVIYFTIGGELNAYGIEAFDLYSKPGYVTVEGGNPTIFAPWYNAETGEGRYKTEFIASRAEDKTDKPKGATLPRTSKRPKHDAVKVDSLEDTSNPVYVYTKRRDFTNAKAKGNNLRYFIKKGQRNQMDPDLQEFVIATTGHEDELPPELVNAIKKGILTRQALFKWFRQVKPEKVNQFTFDLLNEHIFKNNHIHNMQELDDILTIDPSFYWAAAVVLRREGMSLESLIKENDIDKFMQFINSLEGTKWREKIEKLQAKFDLQWISDGRGGYKKENIGWSDKVQNYMRVLTMQWFDGTLAGAFYTANAFRKTARKYEEELRGVASIDVSHSNQKGDKSLTLADRLTDKNTITGDDKTTANDILAIYEMQTNKSDEEMIAALTFAYTEHLAQERGIKFSRNMDYAELLADNPELGQELITYVMALRNMDYDEIERRYADIANSEMTETEVDDVVFDKEGKQYKNTRVNIVARIKRSSSALLKLVREGKVAFTDLPKEVQEMFELKTATTESGKKTEVYELKADVYSVGRGRNKLPGTTDTGRLNYVPKHNITKGNEAFRHDTTAILANDELLRNTLKAVRQIIKQRQSDTKKTIKLVSDLQKRLDTAITTQKTQKKEGKVRETEFRVVTKKSKTSDTPNYFTIVSAIDMPEVLHKLFDVSFEAMANTQVQFASRDENGQLYDKSQFTEKEFNSRVKHEVNNWDAFYEAARTNLLALSRNDVLDIVEFFQRGMSTLNGPVNKLAAFEIFTLGYIVDAARRNLNGWNFSDKEIETIEQVYEAKASAHGSGLNAVQQMLKVVDPFKKVRQRMLDDFNIGDDELQPLFNAVDALQSERDTEARKERAKDVAKELAKIEAMMVQNDVTERGWGKRWYQKLKSYRYMAMLSSPTTWIRNIVSNFAMAGINRSSDAIAAIIFPKKGYRNEQWDLSGVKVSEEVKTFIDENIKNNELFDVLYDKTSKYDKRDKKLDNQRDLFVSMIVNALEQKYAAEHRFDNKVANLMSQFVSRMISDKRFIKSVVGRYFGKMLTIEVQKGNIDLSQGLSNDVLNLFAEAVILGNTEYMHKRSFLADMVDGLRDKHPVAYEVLTLWQPFLNSSFNWFQETLKYTPVGLANAIIRMTKLEQQITKMDAKRAKGEMVTDSRMTEFLIRRDIGKGTLGLLLSGLGIWLALTGILKIEDDDDKFYMVVGDVKVDISNIFGTSSVLIGASIAQLFVKDESGKTASLDKVLHLVTAQMFEGFVLSDLLARHKYDEGFYDGVLTETESVLRSFVPQFWQLLIRATNNEKIRYSPGMAGMWERWLNSFVPTQPMGHRKVNPYTGEIETKYAMPVLGELMKSGILLGPKIFWSEVGEAERMSRELGVNKGELTGELTVDGKKYLLDKIALNQKYGELNKETLAKIKSQKHKVEMPDGTFKTLSWDNMSDEQRARVLNKVMTQNAELAKVYIWTQVMGKKFYASPAMWQRLKELGITRNVYKGDKDFVE